MGSRAGLGPVHSTATNLVGSRRANVAHSRKASIAQQDQPCSCQINVLADLRGRVSRRHLLPASLLTLGLGQDAGQPRPASASGSERLSIEEVEARLRKCFDDGQYYVSGKLDRGIFTDDCLFTDPTIRVEGTEKYAAAVASIFSPESARADLITLRITSPSTMELTWRLEGTITQAGAAFKFKPYTGKTVYTLEATSGKIARQEETWDISQLDVFVSIFWPGFGAPPAPPVDTLRSRVAL